MREITLLDKLLLTLGFLIVLGIFTLAFVLYFKGGICALDPIQYAINHNLTTYNPYQIPILP